MLSVTSTNPISGSRARTIQLMLSFGAVIDGDDLEPHPFESKDEMSSPRQPRP